MAVLCQLADPANYKAFDWDVHQTDADRAYWLDLFKTFPANIEKQLREDHLTGDDFTARWQAFLDEYTRGLARIRKESDRRKRQSTIQLGKFRQSMLDKYGWSDPYIGVKRRENDLAAKLYPAVIREIDTTPSDQRWEMLLRSMFAGNMFDLGCPDTIEMYNRGEIDFHAILARIPDRPWFIDHTDTLIQKLTAPGRCRKTLFFVDNAGTDIVLGVIPMVREMARKEIHVVMAANSSPALNDITIDELDPLLEQLASLDPVLADLRRRGIITTVGSGSGSPLIDLSRISDECDAEARNADLIVLQGMGRGVESNWRQLFKCDVWRVALLKDRSVIGWLGADLFAPLCRFDPGTSHLDP